MYKQLSLFEESFKDKTERTLEEYRQEKEKVRKKLFQEISLLKKELKDLKSRYEILESNLCKGNMLL